MQAIELSIELSKSAEICALIFYRIYFKLLRIVKMRKLCETNISSTLQSVPIKLLKKYVILLL